MSRGFLIHTIVEQQIAPKRLIETGERLITALRHAQACRADCAFQGARGVLVLVEGEEQLREILQASLEEWRIFLHPYQRKMVDWRTHFPIAIRGAAGTGSPSRSRGKGISYSTQAAGFDRVDGENRRTSESTS